MTLRRKAITSCITPEAGVRKYIYIVEKFSIFMRVAAYTPCVEGEE
jgi:hypothetical protein